jgi:predicted aspartyl protease
MARNFPLKAGVVALVLVAGWVGDRKAEARDQEITSKRSQAPEIAIRLRHDYLILASGSIGTARKLSFLIDTGTVPTLISRRLAQKLALHGTEVEIGIWGHRARVSLITLPVLQLGPISVSNLKVFAMDMHPVEQELGIRLDAIVGLDAFAKTSFTIDYVRKVISFGVPCDAENVIAMELRDVPSAYALVEAEIEGKPLHLLLDTGASSLTLLDLRTQQLGLKTNTFVGSAEADMLIPLLLHQIRLGGKAFRVKNAFLQHVRQESLRDFDGFVGPVALGIKRFGMNFATKCVYMELEKGWKEH